MLRRLRVLGALALMIAVPVACTPLEEKANVPFRPPGVNTAIEAADAGRVLYDRAYTHFMLETGRMPLEGPSVPAMRGPSRYTEREIDEIVAYVETFGGT